MTTALKILPLLTPKAPNLPISPVEFNQQFIDQFSNVLRLYFNQLDNYNQGLIGTTGGSNFQFPNGAFHQGAAKLLQSTMTNSSTTNINVTSTTGFLTSGALLIGTEFVGYTGLTSTSFTGITRGLYGSSTSAHAIGDAVSEAQAVVNTTTPLAIKMNSTDASNQVSVNIADNSKIVFAIAGYYNIQFSVQLLQYTTADDNVTFWFRQNGVDIANSAGISTVPSKHGTVGGTAIVSWNLVIPVNADDYIQLMMTSDTGNTVAATYPASTVAPVHPASPSIILTATFVSALY